MTTTTPPAAPAPAVPDLKHKPTVQHLMDLARKFRSTPGDLYDGAYKALQNACYAALSAAPVVPMIGASTHQQVFDALEDAHWLSGPPHERIKQLIAERESAAPVVPSFDRTTALILLQAASKSGDPGAIGLAAQLAGAAPCKDCGYVNFKCRCQSAAPVVQEPQPGVLDPDCNYMAPKGKVCNKCGRIHRGIGGGGK